MEREEAGLRDCVGKEFVLTEFLLKSLIKALLRLLHHSSTRAGLQLVNGILRVKLKYMKYNSLMKLNVIYNAEDRF